MKDEEAAAILKWAVFLPVFDTHQNKDDVINVRSSDHPETLPLIIYTIDA